MQHRIKISNNHQYQGTGTTVNNQKAGRQFTLEMFFRNQKRIKRATSFIFNGKYSLGTLLGWTYEYTFNTHMRSLCYSTAEPSLRRVV